MAATGLALAYYVKNGAGVAGLTVDVTVVSTALADLTEAVVVNAQPMTASATLAGMYRYRVPNLDFENYWYTFKAITAGDVDEKELAGLLHDLTTVEMTAYGVGTADPGDAMTLTAAYDAALTAAQPGDAMTLQPAERTTLAGVVWGYATRTLTSFGTLAADVAAAVWGALTSALTTVGSIGKYIVDYLAAIRAQTDLLDSTEIAILQPVLSNGDVDIVRGDVYQHIDGRRLEWPIPHRDIAADSTIVVVLQNVAALIGVRLNINRVGLELTHAQSIALPAGVYPFSIQEIQADGDPITLLRGRWVTNLYPEPRPGEY